MSDAAVGLGQEQASLPPHEVSEFDAAPKRIYPGEDPNQALKRIKDAKGDAPPRAYSRDLQDLRSPFLASDDNTRQRQLSRIGSVGQFTATNPYMKIVNLRQRNLRNQDLSGIDFRGADLRGVDFTGSDLRNALVYGCDFRGAIMDKVNLQGAYICDSNFSGTRMVGANLSDIKHAADTNFRGTNLHDANLRNSDFGLAKLTGIKLAGSIRQGFSMSSATLFWPSNRINRILGVFK